MNNRYLDAAIAEARGYEVKWLECFEGEDFWYIAPLEMLRVHGKEATKQPCFKNHIGAWEIVPFWSEDGNDMLELEAYMRAQGYHIQDMWYQYHKEAPDYGWYVSYVGHEHGLECGYAKGIATIPLAHALAAIYALTGKEWEGEEM